MTKMSTTIGFQISITGGRYMNIVNLDIGSGSMTFAIIQSIMKKAPIICSNGEARKNLVKRGKELSERLFPGNRVSMPNPVTFQELESGNFNRSLPYIFESLDDYFKFKGINVDTVGIRAYNTPRQE